MQKGVLVIRKTLTASLISLLLILGSLVAGCEDNHEVTIETDEAEGTFEEIGKSMDDTKEAAEDAAKAAEETADKVEDAANGN